LHEVLANYWMLFGFLYVLSIYVFFDVTKENLEFSNHIRAIQWISEKLSLNKMLSEERKKTIEKLRVERELSEEDSKDIMFQGYMALPLPVPMRVHEILQKLMYLFIFGSVWASISGIAIRLNLFSFLQSLSLPAVQLPIDALRLSAYLFGTAGGIILCLYCRKRVKQVKSKAKKLLDLREPEEIRMRYQGEPYFHQTR